MSMDIRSYFTVGAAKKKKPEPPPAPPKRKSTAIVLSDDEDDEVIPETSPPAKQKQPAGKSEQQAAKKRRVIDSDDEAEPPKKKDVTPKKEKKNEVNLADVFGVGPVKREERKEPKRNSVIPSDDEFEADVAMIENGEKSPLKKENGNSPAKKSPKEEKVKVKESPKKEKVTPAKEKASTSKGEQKTPKTTEKAPKRKPKEEEEHVLTDEERHERRRMAAMLYQKMKNRSGPAHPGSKKIPEGKPNCLAGLTFLLTGVYDSLERDEAADLLKKYGGRMVTSVTKKLNYLVVGDEPGPAKVAKADDLGVAQINEDQMLDLIREKSGLKPVAKASPKKEKELKVKEKPSPQKRKEEPDVKAKKEKRDSFGDSKVAKKEKATPEKPKNPPPTLPKKEENPKNLAWVEKYKPQTVKQIVGQQGAASNLHKLLNWLSKWHANHDGKKKLAKPNPWAKSDDGSFYKAALLSGAPGVGKTTTATLVCKELGFDLVEFNASDTRSKRLLKDEVAGILSNQSLADYGHGRSDKFTRKRVLIMDEVDGMAGNEDRGGIAELIALIKDTKVPIICMCNDRNHQKMRSLVNYCYDLRFQKPRLEQIKGAMMSVCFKEGLKLPPGALEEIITNTGNDIRQTLNHLSMYSADKSSKLTKEQVAKEAEIASKNVKFGPWDVVKRVFSAEDRKGMSIHDKSDLFFHDYSLAPLFVQENYLGVRPNAPKSEHLKLIALTSNSLSMGDLVDRRIRSNNAWNLLPVQAMYSSVLPGEYMEGAFARTINFPAWLGKYSKANKRKRLAQEIHDHTRMCTSGSRLSVRLDYAPFLINAILRPLQRNGADGVHEALNVIKEYRLLREDIDSLIELTTWPKRKSPWDTIDGKVKAALTRAYNKEVAPYSYSVMAAVKKKRAVEVEEIEGYGEEGEEVVHSDSENEEWEKIEKLPFIKLKKASKASPKKAKAGGSGKGRKK